MHIEKLEECPICQGQLTQKEYDMQFHPACHWNTGVCVFCGEAVDNAGIPVYDIYHRVAHFKCWKPYNKHWKGCRIYIDKLFPKQKTKRSKQ